MIALVSACAPSTDKPINGSRFHKCSADELAQATSLGGHIVLPQNLNPGHYQYLGSTLIVALADNGKTQSAVVVHDKAFHSDFATQVSCSTGFGEARLLGQSQTPFGFYVDPDRNWIVDQQRDLSLEMDQNDIVHYGGTTDQAEVLSLTEIQDKMDSLQLAGGDFYLVSKKPGLVELVLTEEVVKEGRRLQRQTLRTRYQLSHRSPSHGGQP